MNSDFEMLRQLLNRRSGLSLDAEKAYLAESRLQPLVQQLGLSGLGGLVKMLLSGAHEDLEREVVEAMTTNETFFFRDRVPFDNFRKVIIPYLLQARRDSRQIRIWCAACSTGQEPYSLAMLLDEEAHRLAGWKIEILATDLSRGVINTARNGIYSQFEIQRGLPITQLLRYFRQEGERWCINEYLRSRIRFEEFNLLSDYAPLGRFDVIFCRNVLIYFDVPTKKDVLDRMAKILAPDGFFIMGAAETVIGLTDALVPHPEHRSVSIVRPETPPGRPALALVAS
ncbi:protein-glutamate O-methyltransferase CheR [uncultured Methylovirgula sp.]|uniref:CheR family methyltransferase n=1 Tax=uncultured Methylovirgula sp. TaxID=1285960 RepID=UPI00263634F7|nr:protein-glutamate O-methyltransferase CheR [uncultured Methylovirgula sp.]